MSVNGVTSSTAAAYSYPATENVKTDTRAQAAATVAVQQPGAAAESAAKTEASAADKGVVYDRTSGKDTATKATYKPDTNLINKLKADSDARIAQMRSMVEKMMAGQASAYGNANDIWTFLRKGNFTVDPAVQKQAQADIAEDGYWGVEQTSDRIIEFAKALTGGDPSKVEDMRAAFEKGFKKAEKTWGDKLPDISQRTYKAVMEKFDKMAEEAKKAAPVPTEDASK